MMSARYHRGPCSSAGHARSRKTSHASSTGRPASIHRRRVSSPENVGVCSARSRSSVVLHTLLPHGRTRRLGVAPSLRVALESPQSGRPVTRRGPQAVLNEPSRSGASPMLQPTGQRERRCAAMRLLLVKRLPAKPVTWVFSLVPAWPPLKLSTDANAHRTTSMNLSSSLSVMMYQDTRGMLL
jgi:hypothetical protein